ncbi:hypothetical protein [Lysobacter sp. P5_B9]
MCEFETEMVKNAAALQSVAAFSPIGILLIALVVGGLAINKRTRHLPSLAWLALCLWLGPFLAAKPTVVIWYKVMFGSGDCIGTPWLTMIPALLLAIVVAMLVVGGMIFVGSGPMLLYLAKSSRAQKNASRHPPPLPGER